jgi:hypothetical protein
MHQKTITLHSLPKRGVVVWRSGMWCNGIFMHPKNRIFFVVPLTCYFGHKPFFGFFICLVLLMIQNLFYTMTGISPEMTGNQHSCCAFNKIPRKCKQKNWLPTIPFASSLSKHMGLQALQDCKERRCQWLKKEQGDLVGFLHDFTRSLHTLSNFRVSFCLANTVQICPQIYWKCCIFVTTR